MGYQHLLHLLLKCVSLNATVMVCVCFYFPDQEALHKLTVAISVMENSIYLEIWCNRAIQSCSLSSHLHKFASTRPLLSTLAILLSKGGFCWRNFTYQIFPEAFFLMFNSTFHVITPSDYPLNHTKEISSSCLEWTLSRVCRLKVIFFKAATWLRKPRPIVKSDLGT